MKKTLLIFLSLLIGLSVYASEFKVGDAKYVVLTDGTVELKEFKKAAGDVVIPEKVTDPKGGTLYTVSAIGTGAFKKAPLTSISLPNTVKSIGEQAFKDCSNLVKVCYPDNLYVIPFACFLNCKSLKSFDFKGIKIIDGSAFKGSGLTSLDIPESVKMIGPTAFGSCPDLKAVSVQYSDEGLEMYPGVMYGTPVESVVIERALNYKDLENFLDKFRLYNNNHALKSLWIGPNVPINPNDKYLEDCPNAVVVFIDKNAGKQAWNLLRSMCGDSAISWVDAYYKPGGNKNTLGHVIPFEDYITATLSHRNMSLPQGSFYFGVEETENGPALSQDSPYNTARALQVAYENYDKENFLKKLQEFIRVAVNEPQNLPYEYRNIDPKEAVKYNSYITNAIRVLCDSVYLVKPELSEAEAKNVGGFINNLLAGIGADYDLPNMRLEDWAAHDILTADLATGDHKEDYERILKSIDRYFTFVKPADDPYNMANQLACLCALGRWKEAATYYPKVHRAVTGNGKYYQKDLPVEITYMQKAINAHGFKAIAPSYARASASSSKSNGSLFQFFMDKAIKAGIEVYKQRKAQKEFRELYYDSIGLDAKGRPRKSKK